MIEHRRGINTRITIIVKEQRHRWDVYVGQRIITLALPFCIKPLWERSILIGFPKY